MLDWKTIEMNNSRNRKPSSRTKKNFSQKKNNQKVNRNESSKDNNDSKKDEIPVEGIRLNRFIANAGVCSRREADKLIKDGKITVNKKVMTEMGFRVKSDDVVRYRGKVLVGEQKKYILLNKPKGFITTMKDPKERRTVMQLVQNACEERIYPVGRLDRETTGLLLFTNDGELAKKLSHPSYEVRKVYRVELNKPLTEEHFDQIKEGFDLEDGPVKVDELAINAVDKTTLGVEIHIGRNRIVRRLFEHLGYEVIKLDRTAYAGLTKIDLPRGKWRELKDKEVVYLTKFLRRNKTNNSK